MKKTKKRIKTKNYPIHILEFLKSKGIGEIKRVQVRRKGLTGSGLENRCHQNVCNLIATYGGKRLAGFLPIINTFHGSPVLTLTGHSVWMTPENKMVDVTATNFTQEDYIDFMPLFEDIGYNVGLYEFFIPFVKSEDKIYIIPEDMDDGILSCDKKLFSINYIIKDTGIENKSDWIGFIDRGGFKNASSSNGMEWSDIKRKKLDRNYNPFIQIGY